MHLSGQTELLYRMVDVLSTRSHEGNAIVLQLLDGVSVESDNLVKYSNDCLSKISATFGGMKYELNAVSYSSKIKDLKKE